MIVTVVPTAQDEPAMWRYTMRRPGEGWFTPDFDASSWREGKSGFGTAGTPGAIVNTVWDTRDIWLRREFTLPEGKWGNLGLSVHHDEDVEIYINGVLAATANGYTTRLRADACDPGGQGRPQAGQERDRGPLPPDRRRPVHRRRLRRDDRAEVGTGLRPPGSSETIIGQGQP